ncbi:MAG: tRNA uracil 4-sulfurtransferase ThiI [Bacillota bacterium]|jgi:thiamine biosynthesis protein ThiI
MEEVLLVRYGEISLKGKNRPDFEGALVDHLRSIMREYPGSRLQRSYGRMFLYGMPMSRDLMARMAKVPGVVAASAALKVENDLELIKEGAIEAARRALGDRTAHVGHAAAPPTFKIEARRSLKSFPVTSPEICVEVGAAVLDAGLGLSVDVHSPSFTISIEVRHDGTYIYWGETRGMGGLPLGSSGKGMVLLSGGIDSPVAAYMAMKRGVALDALHFWSFPMTGEKARDKVVRLWRMLREYNPSMNLYIAHFTKIQTAIIELCPEKYRVTIMRRMMMRVATELGKKVGALAIFTGENLAQVASQTLESMAVIEEVAGLPVLRPLLCFDKNEIVKIAESIGTYDVSCLPYEDCCTVFVPKHPVTKPRLDLVMEAEQALPVDDLVKECVESIEAIRT